MSEHKIALITDSTCDLPLALREQYAITVVPLSVVWGDKQLYDGVDMQPEDFYQRLMADPVYPTTAQPAPQHFLAAYERARQQGAREVIVLTISRSLSRTYESAQSAITMSDMPVHLVDSKSASMGLGWQVLAAARAREAGGDAAAMIAAAEAVRQQLRFIIMLDTLEYLHRGGRIGGASAFLGTLLDYKPQISLNPETGTIEAMRRERTRQKALQAMYDDFFNQLDIRKKMYIAVLHTAAQAEAEALAARIRLEFMPHELFISIVCPTLGVHSGPRSLALCGYTGD